MSPSLETKLAQIVGHVERLALGVGALIPSVDKVGLRHLLNDAEVSAWLDSQRRAGIPTGPFINQS